MATPTLDRTPEYEGENEPLNRNTNVTPVWVAVYNVKELIFDFVAVLLARYMLSHDRKLLEDSPIDLSIPGYTYFYTLAWQLCLWPLWCWALRMDVRDSRSTYSRWSSTQRWFWRWEYDSLLWARCGNIGMWILGRNINVHFSNSGSPLLT